jgi:hypothetical protein
VSHSPVKKKPRFSFKEKKPDFFHGKNLKIIFFLGMDINSEVVPGQTVLSLAMQHTDKLADILFFVDHGYFLLFD